MADAVVVAVLQPIHQLLEIEPGLLLRQLPFVRNLVEEFSAPDELQHDEDLRRRRKDIFHRHHVVMIDHLHDRDLFLDLGTHVAGLNLVLVQDLDGHRLVGLGVHGVFHSVRIITHTTEYNGLHIASSIPTKPHGVAHLLAKGAFAQGAVQVVLADSLHHVARFGRLFVNYTATVPPPVSAQQPWLP